MAATSFKIRNLAPPDLRNYGRGTQLMFHQWCADLALKAKDGEMARGLAADGQPLAAVSAKTRKYRRSAMTPTGKGDPSAPYLMPARALSRSRSLLAARALPTHVDMYWRFDPFTGESWGDILAIHARRGPRYDLIGISDEAVRRIRAQAWEMWERYKRGQLPAPAPPSIRKPAGMPRVGTRDYSKATFGIGAAGPPTGKATGGLTWPQWRRYLTQPAPAAVPGRPRRWWNRLLALVWREPG